MPQVQTNGINIEYELIGDQGPVIVLVMGLGMQMVAWPDEFIAPLTNAGYRVLRFDNRDVGRSTWFDDLGCPSLFSMALKHALRLTIKSPYSLSDMANDALGVCDALGIKQAHWIGVSMGGMIAQLLAANHPTRVASLISVMSSSGARSLPGPTSATRKAMLQRAPNLRTHADPKARAEAWVEHTFKLLQTIGSPANPLEDAGAQTRAELETRARIHAANKRAFHPAGTLRQTAAILADGDRSARLQTIKTPTLVIHGEVDPLLPIACGYDTAKKITGSRFVPVMGMGHDLAPVAQTGILAAVLPFIAQHAVT